MQINNNLVGYIYSMENCITNKIYIGMTTRSPKRRIYEHKYDSKRKDSDFYRDIDKYGIKSFKFEILEEIHSCDLLLLVERLREREQYYISIYDTCLNGYNISIGGGGANGVILSDDARAKISITHKGKRLSPEHKKRISEFMSSNKNPHLGKKMTEEQKVNLSKKMKGRYIGENNPMYGAKRPDLSQRNLESSHHIVQIDMSTGNAIAFWDSIRQAERSTGYSRCCIADCCKGKTKSSHGYLWMYLDEYSKRF